VGRLFRYEGGVYSSAGELYVKRQVKQLIVKFGNAGRWNRALAQEVIEFIALDAPELRDRPDTDTINLTHGILNVWTGELLPHTPSSLSPVRIPIVYEATANCARIEEFIEQVFPSDSAELAWEILGDLLTADRSIQKAICIVGEDGNGKSVFCQLCVNFLGEQNVVHLSLQRLENDRFTPASSMASSQISAPIYLIHAWKTAPFSKPSLAAIASPVNSNIVMLSSFDRLPASSSRQITIRPRAMADAPTSIDGC
jgi:hypothetical protein